MEKSEKKSKFHNDAVCAYYLSNKGNIRSMYKKYVYKKKNIAHQSENWWFMEPL